MGTKSTKAFEDIKCAFRIMLFYKYQTQIKHLLETDASLVAIAAVLIQEDRNGNERPCASILELLIKRNKLWSLWSRILAIVESLKHWRHLLKDIKIQLSFSVITRNLVTITSAIPNPSTNSLATTSFTISYQVGIHPGSQLIAPDAYRDEQSWKTEPIQRIVLPETIWSMQ